MQEPVLTKAFLTAVSLHTGHNGISHLRVEVIQQEFLLGIEDIRIHLPVLFTQSKVAIGTVGSGCLHLLVNVTVDHGVPLQHIMHLPVVFGPVTTHNPPILEMKGLCFPDVNRFPVLPVNDKRPVGVLGIKE